MAPGRKTCQLCQDHRGPGKKSGRKDEINEKNPHKTSDSQILWITYILNCHNELSEFAPRFWVYTSAQPATHGAVLGRILDFEMYEDLKWRFTWKEKVDGPDWAGQADPRTVGPARPREGYNCAVISTLNDVLTPVSSYGKYFWSLKNSRHNSQSVQ